MSRTLFATATRTAFDFVYLAKIRGGYLRFETRREAVTFHFSPIIDNPAVSAGKTKARFIAPMEAVAVAKLPEGVNWTWEIKLDGWRMEVVKASGRVTLYSRRGKDFTSQFDFIARELQYLPDETVIDGEVVGLDEEGRPSFNLIHAGEAHVVFYAFDILICGGDDLMRRPLSERREILHSIIRAEGHVGISQHSNQALPEMIKFIQSHNLEGIVAKHASSSYQPGKRTGLWLKYRMNRVRSL